MVNNQYCFSYNISDGGKWTPMEDVTYSCNAGDATCIARGIVIEDPCWWIGHQIGIRWSLNIPMIWWCPIQQGIVKKWVVGRSSQPKRWRADDWQRHPRYKSLLSLVILSHSLHEGVIICHSPNRWSLIHDLLVNDINRTIFINLPMYPLII